MVREGMVPVKQMVTVGGIVGPESEVLRAVS